MNKYVKVVAGIKERHEQGEGANHKSWTEFVVKKTIVVEARHLAALFRRDDKLCSMAIRLEDTHEKPTTGMFFSDQSVV
jgi:hypothetical protein